MFVFPLKRLTQYVPDLIVQRGAIRIFRLHHIERLKTFLCYVFRVCIKTPFPEQTMLGKAVLIKRRTPPVAETLFQQQLLHILQRQKKPSVTI